MDQHVSPGGTARFLYIQHCCGVTQVRNTRLSLVSSTNAASTCMYQFSHERSVANSHIKASFDLRTLAKNVFIDLHFIHYVTNLTRNKRRSRKPHHHFHLPILCFTLQRFPLNTYHSFLISFGTLWMNLKFVQNTFILNILTYEFGLN